jgi:hypothetical protein
MNALTLGREWSDPTYIISNLAPSFHLNSRLQYHYSVPSPGTFSCKWRIETRSWPYLIFRWHRLYAAVLQRTGSNRGNRSCFYGLAYMDLLNLQSSTVPTVCCVIPSGLKFVLLYLRRSVMMPGSLLIKRRFRPPNKRSCNEEFRFVAFRSPSLFYLLVYSRCRGILFSLITLKHTPQSVGLLWTRDRPVAETVTWQQKYCTRDKHPCPRRDSNPQSQQALGRRPTP